MSLKRILIPADLTGNTEIAIRKGMALAESSSSIHLLHVQNYGYPGLSFEAYRFLRPDTKKDYERISHQLEEWKRLIENSTGINTFISINIKDSVQKGIENEARLLNPDIIIIAKHSHHVWMPFLNTVRPGKIAKHTGMPVLTIKPGSAHCKTKSIMIPVGAGPGEKTKEIIEIINKKNKLKVYLVAFIDDFREPTDFYQNTLTRFNQWVSMELRCPVEYTVLRGNNRAKLILEYAEQVNADMVILSSDKEIKTGWIRREILDMVLPNSKLQVLLTRL
jgi:nucleotide-binding universal stress UspA family protein